MAGSDLNTFIWLETHLDVWALSKYIIDMLLLLAENCLNARKKSGADIVFVNAKWTVLVKTQVNRQA